MKKKLPLLGRLMMKMAILITLLMGTSLYGMEVEFQKSPLKITVKGGERTLVEVTEFSVGPHVYDTIQSVLRKGDVYEVLFPDQKVMTISPVKNGVRISFDPSCGSEDVTIRMNHLGGHFFGIRERNVNGINPDVTGLTMDVGMASGGGGEAWAGAFSTFYMNTRGYGSFFDTFYNGSYKLGISGEIELMHQDCGVIDWYIFHGPTGEKIHEGLFSVIGKPQKIPMWACGPTVWRNDNTGSAEILNDADQYIALEIPLTHWWVDRPYSDGYNAWSKMNFKATFPDPSAWIGHLNDEGIEFSTWITPAMFGIEAACPLQLAGEFGYVDLSHQGAYDWYKNKLKTLQYVHGVKGHKIDRVDEKFPVEVEWADGTAAEARWNTYAYLNAKAAGEALAESHPDDHFLFARVAYNRSQQYLDAVWGGDVGATLKDMGENMCNAMRCSYMGYPIWGTDGGGYFSDDISDDQYIRWTQFCLYNGMFEFMIDNRLPWEKSETLQTALQKIHTRRMELLPYIYSLANTSDRTGVMMQPMAYRYPNDSKTYPMWDQYFFGAAFLVAPIYEDNSTNRSVYLPEGIWIDQHNYAASYSGNQTISYDAPQSVVPTFIKDNTIYPDGMVYAGNMKSWDVDFNNKRHLNINAFPGGAETSSSFIYVDFLDNDVEKELQMATDSAGSVAIAFPTMTTGGSIFVRLEGAPVSVILNGITISNPAYDVVAKLLTVPYQSGKDIKLLINMNQGLSSAFMERSGLVVMEGENFQALDVRNDPDNITWGANSGTAGFTGSGYVEAAGSKGGNGSWENAAEVSYTVKFSTAGVYQVWVRRLATSQGDNRVFTGLNNVSKGESDTGKPESNWVWQKLGTLEVDEPGLQLFQLRRGQAGYKVDRIILTTNLGTPSGNGPAESPIHVNSLPEISSSPKGYVDAGTPFNYMLVATDQDQDSIELLAELLPAWLTLSDGVLSGTAGVDDIGLHPVTLRASDGIGNSDQSFAITVSAQGNDAPIIGSTPSTRVIENQSYRYAISATDADGDSLTYRLPVKPEWLSLSDNTISGTPLSGSQEISPVVLTVSDGAVTVTQQFNVAVFERPTPDNVLMNASFEDGTTSWSVGTAEIVGTEAQDRNSSLRITKASAPSIKQTARLEIGKKYTISVWINTAGITGGNVVFDTTDAYDGPGQGQFVASKSNGGWTPYSGSFTADSRDVTIRMFTDGDFAGAVYFDNIVLAEAGISNAAPIITSIPKSSAEVNQPYQYQLLAADAENDGLTFSISDLPKGLYFDAAARIISGTPVDVGDYDMVVKVSDGKTSVVQNFTISVK